MPKLDYTDMPFTRQQSTEQAPENAFYNISPDAEESPDIFRGYYTYNFFGLVGADD